MDYYNTDDLKKLDTTIDTVDSNLGDIVLQIGEFCPDSCVNFEAVTANSVGRPRERQQQQALQIGEGVRNVWENHRKTVIWEGWKPPYNLGVHHHHITLDSVVYLPKF